MSYYLTILAGIILGLSFLAPQFSLLAWLGLVPFLKALEKKSKRKSFKLGWIFGITFLTVSSNWLLEPIIKFSGYPLGISTLIFLICAAILALYFALFALILNFLRDYLSLTDLILVPLVWTGIEFLRSIYSFQFLFAFLGYSQSFSPELIQLAQIGGVYLITFLIASVNTIFYLVLNKEKKRDKVIYLSIAILIMASIFMYGKVQLKEELSTVKSLKISLIQPNIPQYKKLDSDYQTEIKQKLIQLSQEEIKTRQPNLLVWPETAILRTYQIKQKFPYLRDAKTPLYIGGFIRKGNGPLNSALLVNKNGKIIKRYSKNILVPWGEYVPFPNFVPDFIETNLNHITPGTKSVKFKLGEINWIGAICSEILNPNYIRDSYAQNDFIINISNEAWFGDSSAPRQVLQAVIFRAVEHQVPIVKVGNTGVSGVINAQGELIKKTDLLTTAALTVNLNLPAREKTIYYMIGDIFGKGSLIFSLILVLIVIYQKFLQRS